MTLRPGRTPEVGVTGGAHGLGRALLALLAGTVATRPLPLLRGDELRRALLGVTTLVHLETTYDVTLPAADRRALNVGYTARVLEAALEAGVDRVVLTTSAEVYGPPPGADLPLPDDAPLAGEPDDVALVGDHVEVERLAAHALLTGLGVTVLRPATLVGGRLGPAYDGQQLRQLAGPRLLALRGVEPQWQLCHADDLLAALALAATGHVTGGLGVASDGSVPQAVVERLSGRRRLELPAAVALGTAERLHRLGVTTSSPRELDHLLSPLVLAADGLRAAGWEPAWTNEDALRAHLAARRRDGRGGGATAAGATVALVGTAALVRQARRRRPR